ncbi:MAG: hypothetical protein ABMA25_09750 [Ilumatobacteraceae bacterium]
MTSTARKAMSLAIATITVVVVVMLAQQRSRTVDPAAADYRSADEAMQEYVEETARLDLPTGAVFPAEPSALPAFEGSVPIFYEPGVGTQTAQLYWYCAWAKFVLADNPEALDRLGEFEHLAVWSKIDDYGHEMFSTQLDAAREADLRPLASYVEQNCAEST